MKRQTFFYILLIVAAMLAGNVFDPVSLIQENNRANREECVPPIGTWSFRGSPPIKSPASPEPVILPSGNWQFISNLPITDKSPSIIIARTSNEVWVNFSPRSELWRYSVNSNEWKEYSEVDKFSGSSPNISFLRSLGADGKLWSFAYIQKTPTEGYGGISFYNEKTDRFELIDYDQKTASAYEFRWSGVEQDQNGVFWIMAQEIKQKPPFGGPRALFSLDPVTGKFEQHGDFQWSGGLAVGPDGNVWIVTNNNYSEYPHDKLVQFNPSTNEFHSYPDIELPYNTAAIYFDRSGRLWVVNFPSSDDGWVDLSDPNKPVFYVIIPQPEFLSRIQVGNDQLNVWGAVAPYQSSDGTLWFVIEKGLVKLNPQTNEWCKVTNGESVFTEDDQGNMWLAVSGKLYKYSLAQ